MLQIWSFWALSAIAAAQTPDAIQPLLQPDAQVIEKADIGAAAGKPRALVLWMIHPERHVRQLNAGYCGDGVYGDYWEGPTRLSLVDPVARRLINTVEIRDPGYGGDAPADRLRLPFLVPDYVYSVPRQSADHEGKPELLHFRDLTGDGNRLEFVLYMYEACGIVTTSALGYNIQSDRAIQYPVEVQENNNEHQTKLWVEQIFAQEPIRPGYWKFSWSPGHGLDVEIEEELSFDSKRQVFIEKQNTLNLKPQ